MTTTYTCPNCGRAVSDHAGILSDTNKRRLSGWMNCPENWCPGCQESYEPEAVTDLLQFDQDVLIGLLRRVEDGRVATTGWIALETPGAPPTDKVRRALLKLERLGVVRRVGPVGANRGYGMSRREIVWEEVKQ